MTLNLTTLASARGPDEPQLRVQIPEAARRRALATDQGPPQLSLRDTRVAPDAAGVSRLTLLTDQGEIDCRWHAPAGEPAERAVVWVGGAGGGLDGPARGLYPAAARRLTEHGVGSLCLHYRQPNQLKACVLDTLLAVAFLRTQGARRTALVGHSFGGAVVITAGALAPDVTAVVPLSTQTYGTELAGAVSPRPMLLVHGANDEVLPPACSELVYAAAREPKQLVLYPGAKHGLDSVREPLLDLLVAWLAERT